MNAAGIHHRTIRTNGIRIHIAEAGTGPVVILLHGFPELWYSWRHQLFALSASGYRAVAPDQRGYGRTDRPEAIEAYDILELAADVTGLLDALGAERGTIVGHDWGAVVAWHLALGSPERVAAVAAMSVPFIPRPPARPTELLRAVAGDRFHYILYFQEVGTADRELARDPRRTLARTLWSVSGDAPRGSARPLPREGTGFLDGLSDPPRLPPWLSEEDLDVYASAFGETGFTGALNWYRNLDRNWKLTEHLSGRHVTIPSLFVAGALDPVLRMMPPRGMDGWVDDLRRSVLLPEAGHWIQQERPDEVNRALLGFLAETGGRRGRSVDETGD